jgi:hypothetical protein
MAAAGGGVEDPWATPPTETELAGEAPEVAAPSTVGDDLVDLGRATRSGLTWGLADEAGGRFQGVLQALANRFPNAAEAVGIDARYPQAPEDIVTEATAGERLEDAQGRARSPGLSFTGEVGGGLARDALLSVAGLAPLAAPPVSGAISGFGNSEASLADDPARLAIDTGVGAATGWAAGKVGEKLGGAIRNVGNRAAQRLGRMQNEAWRKAVAAQDEEIASAAGRAAKQAQEAVGGRFNYEEAYRQRGLPPPRSLAPAPAGVSPDEWAELVQRRMANAQEAMRDLFDAPVQVPKFSASRAQAAAHSDLAAQAERISSNLRKALASAGARFALGHQLGGAVGGFLGAGGSTWRAAAALLALKDSPAFLAKWSSRLMTNPERWGRAGVLLSQAAQAGPNALRSALDQALELDPEFAATVAEDEGLLE